MSDVEPFLMIHGWQVDLMWSGDRTNPRRAIARKEGEDYLQRDGQTDADAIAKITLDIEAHERMGS